MVWWTGNLGSLLLTGKPHGPFLQRLNAIVHQEPYQTISYCVYWSIFLILIPPLVGVILVGIILPWKLYLQYYHKHQQQCFVPNKKILQEEDDDEEEFAVLITGCDSGFGKEIAIRLAKEGFVVFAGCLDKDLKSCKRSFFASSSSSSSSSSSGDNNNNHGPINNNNLIIKPLWMDVTKQDHIDNAFRTINEWLLFQDTAPTAGNLQQQAPSSQQLPHRRRRRYLHALINNAGVGRTGYIDWNDISAYELCMNVNCFSQIRTVKTFLPIFKRQARDRRHRHRVQQRRATNNDEDSSSSLSSSSSRFLRSRILNINSAAGILPSGGLAASPYEVAKNAAVAFTDSLRLEMKMFDVDVVSVNPSFHATPLADPKRIEREIREQTWNPLLQSKKDEYGNGT